MRWRFLLMVLFALGCSAVRAKPAALSLAAFAPHADGVSDDTPAFEACFKELAKNGSGTLTIPPGDYFMKGDKPVPLCSGVVVSAQGARFHLPMELGEKARIVLFSGENISYLTWEGGLFLGDVFDPARQKNTWEPDANTRMIVITTTRGGQTHDLTFRDVQSNGIAGAVINVEGLPKKGSEREVDTHAARIHVENCTLLRSGKFMWDYGYLWQIMTWPEEYQPWEVERAAKYFHMDHVRSNVQMDDGDDRVRFDNTSKPIKVSESAEPQFALTFMGKALPKNLVRGRQYFVVEAAKDFIKIAEAPHGMPVRFKGAAGEGCAIIHNLAATYLGAYAPIGSGPGKGGVDISSARDIRITGCQLSALGDTMHVQRSQNVIFANNHILGSRMGAFFLAEFCKNATITGNLVDGTNGSRVMSVEKSSEDVTITGNTFRGGGRGSWINQPKNFILQGNIFVDNTTKGEPDMKRGRRSYQTGEPVRFPEIYFTVWEKDGSYGPVTVRDNIFVLGDSVDAEAVTFAAGGHDIQVTGNTFQNKTTPIVVDPSCQNVIVQDNLGAELKVRPVDFQHGRR
jgi:hypothetical protein